jgi:hypothetical protein
MVAARAPADDAAPRCFKVPEMKAQPRSLSRLLNRLLNRWLNGWSSGSLPASLPRLMVLLRPAAVTAQAVRRRRAEPDVAAEPPGACGWFDSSHELVQGLQVQELTSPESQAAALPLATWLQLQLEGCGGARPA